MASAEQIVRRTHPRVQVRQVRALVHRREIARRHEADRGLGLGGRPAIEGVESQPVVERQATAGPLILDEEPDLPGPVLYAIWRRPLGETGRHTVQELVLQITLNRILLVVE